MPRVRNLNIRPAAADISAETRFLGYLNLSPWSEVLLPALRLKNDIKTLSLSLSHTHTHTHSVPAWTVWRIFLTVRLVRPVPAVVVAVASPGLQDALLVATLVLVRLAHVERSLVMSRFNILLDWTRTKTKLSILFLSSFDHSDSWKSEADNLIDQNRQPET